ncbi:hypothetical protein K492DRAFT_205126 [Lichtheimia hyalospora FSU 10163]|nr:hypothetical protein K492DRAFT_205126 [Lichtheimia hyalospora FSU 10163]
MVATHHRRQPSGGGSSITRRGSERGAGVNGARRRSSLRRPSDRPPRISTPPRRASGGSLLKPGNTSQHNDIRRPSAPAPAVPRLSIADQFMSPNYPRSPSPLKNQETSRASSIAASTSELSNSTTAASSQQRSPSPAVERDPNRLTIADMFTKDRKPSFSSIRTMGDDQPTATENSSSASQVHPLESSTQNSNSNNNDNSGDTFESRLNLDLSLPSTLAAPPDSAWNGRRYSRPFGSQDTLVQSPGSQEKHKKDSADYSVADYYTDNSCSSSTVDQNHDSEKKTGQQHRWRDMGREESGTLSHYEDDLPPPRGIWIGCCFLSCGGGERSLMHEERKRRRQQERQQQQNKKQHGKAGVSCGRRGWVFGIFIVFILLIATGYILWPRTPLMRIEGASLVSAPKLTETHQNVMVGNVAFESQWVVNVTVDNRSNRVPTHLTHIDVLAKDALTGQVIGKGPSDISNDMVLPPSDISTIQLPVVLDYQARDDTDTTFANLKKACTQQPPKTYHDAKTNRTITEQPERESLQLHFWITLHIFGLDWVGYKPTVIATPATGGFACPLS